MGAMEDFKRLVEGGVCIGSVSSHPLRRCNRRGLAYESGVSLFAGGCFEACWSVGMGVSWTRSDEGVLADGENERTWSPFSIRPLPTRPPTLACRPSLGVNHSRKCGQPACCRTLLVFHAFRLVKPSRTTGEQNLAVFREADRMRYP